MMKIIIYVDWIETYLTLEHFMFAKELEKYGWTLIKLSEIKVNELKKHKSIILCITYDSFDVSELKCENVKIIYKIDDLYPYKDIRKKCIDNADIIIGPYQYLFNSKNIIKMYPSIINKENYHIPYSAVSSFYENIEFNKNPKEKIFVSGNISEVYPLRTFIFKNMKKYIETLNHPGYNNNNRNHKIINKEYYKKLSEYLCCFTDASAYNYILLKTFEICSVGSLLLCEDSISNELSSLGFNDNINYISCNKQNFESKINWILDKKNRNQVDEIRINGMKLIREFHNTNNRAKYLNNIINNIQ